MENPEVRFNRIIKENNLTLALSKPVIKYVDGGGIIVEQSLLQVTFADPNLELKKEAPKSEQTTEAVEGETPAN